MTNATDNYFKDSGERAVFETGAQRDIQDNKGRYDLLPPDAVQQLARVLEVGCIKYGDRNWEKGIPLRRYLDSALRHLSKFQMGRTDEPHLPMAMWNIACLIQTEVWIREGRLRKDLREEFPYLIRLLPTEELTALDTEQLLENTTNLLAEIHEHESGNNPQCEG